MSWPPLGISMVALVSLASIAACGRAVTPAELAAYEEHAYAGHSRDEVFKATVVALKTLGYEVVTVDAGARRVKTAPKIVAVYAARTSAYTAVAASEGVAWTIDVADADRGARVHAEPRLYSAGQAVDASHLNQAYAEGAFSTLYAEIDSNLTHTSSLTSSPSSSSSSATGTTTTTAAPAKLGAPTKRRRP